MLLCWWVAPVVLIHFFVIFVSAYFKCSNSHNLLFQKLACLFVIFVSVAFNAHVWVGCPCCIGLLLNSKIISADLATTKQVLVAATS